MHKYIFNIYNKSQEYNYHTNTLGFIRSLLALSTLFVILFNPLDILFHTGLGVPSIPNCNGTLLSKINFFCIFSFNPYLSKIIAILILMWVISGFYPKITGLLHWWLALSVNTGLVIVDGGAQIASALTFLIIPLTLTDNRINHWYSVNKKENEYFKISDFVTIQILKIQVAIIYFDAAISKLFAPNWTEGTALYYFINDPSLGATGIRLNLLNVLFDFPLLLVLTTYFIIILELFLAISIFIKCSYFKHKLFILGIIFHILIFLVFGIFTFVIAMFSALLLLLIPINKEINLQKISFKYYKMKTEEKPTKQLLEQWHKDPKNWNFGIFYFNKDDKRVFPPKRNKYFGWTVNFANLTSIIALFVLVIIIIAISKFIKTL